MNSPSISILIPVYNASLYLDECLRSILNQSFVDFEVLIIDDCSTDGSLAIANKYHCIDDRFHIIAKDFNSGMADSLNLGLENARAELVVRIDADDFMLEDRLERQYQFMIENHDVSVSSSFVYLVNVQSKKIGINESPFITDLAVKNCLADGNLIGIPHPAVIARKSVLLLLGGYRGQFWPAEDVDLWTRVAEAGYRLIVQPEYLTCYRIHSGSVSVSSALKARKMYKWVKLCKYYRMLGEKEPSLSEFENYLSKRSFLTIANDLRKDYSFLYYKSSARSLSDCSYFKAFRFFILALFLDPFKVFRLVYNRVRLN